MFACPEMVPIVAVISAFTIGSFGFISLVYFWISNELENENFKTAVRLIGATLFSAVFGEMAYQGRTLYSLAVEVLKPIEYTFGMFGAILLFISSIYMYFAIKEQNGAKRKKG